MATNTTNYGWTKPSYEDAADIEVINGTIDNIDAQVKTNENNISTVSDANGTKNLLDFNDWASKVNTTRATKSISGNSITLTATGNDAYTDGVVATCPASGKIACEPNTTYVITWETTSTSISDNVYIFPANASPYYRAATAKYIEYTMPAGCKYFTFRFGVANSGDTVTYSNIMICEKSLYDISNQYKPYALSNAELTTKEKQNENNILWNTNNGVKNIINNTAAASTESAGIVWTKNADGSMTGNGTCTGTSGVRVVGTQGVHTYAAAVSIPRGTYIVAPTGKNRTNEQFIMYLWTNSGVTGQSITINTSAYEFTVDNDTTKFDFSVSFTGTNVQISNDTLYPMICLKSLYNADPTYQPYAMSNAELTAAIQALQAQLANQ